MTKRAFLIFLFASSLAAQVQIGKNVLIGSQGTGTTLKMKIVGPVPGQYVILYPGGHSSLPPLSGHGTLDADNNSAAFSQNPSVGQCCAEVDWNGFSLPAFINPANVTAVYAATIASYANSFFNTNNPSVNSSCSNSITPFFMYNTSSSFSQKQFSTLMTSTPGSLIPSITCGTQIAGAGTVNGGVGAVDVAAIALIVYYTGPAPPLDTAISILTPLQYITATNSLGIDISYPFPGLNLLATTVAGLPQAQISLNSLYLIRDGTSSSDCTAGGGSTKVECFSNGTSWSAFAGGGEGGGSVTSFAAPSGSWPTWLVPTVTNSTATPSLAVAASAIPNSALANAATTVNGQTCALGSTCTIPGTITTFTTTGTSGVATYSAGTLNIPNYSAGGTGISGLTAGFIPQAGSATTITGNSHIDEVTNPGSETITQPVIINSTGPSQQGMTYNSTPATVGSGTTAVYAVNSSGQAVGSEAGAAFSRFCTAANGACSSGGSAIVASAEVVTFSATPTFSTAFNTSRIVLTGNITTFTLAAGADGQDKKLCFKQGAGPFTVTPPANVHGFFTVGTTNANWNCQAFNYDNTDSIWLATTTGVINQ